MQISDAVPGTAAAEHRSPWCCVPVKGVLEMLRSGVQFYD